MKKDKFDFKSISNIVVLFMFLIGVDQLFKGTLIGFLLGIIVMLLAIGYLFVLYGDKALQR